MSYNATNWPPLQIPPVVSSTGVGATVTPSPAPPEQLPTVTAQKQTWTASAPPVDITRPVTPNYQATQQQINRFFGIVSINPGQASPNSNVVPGGDIPT